jgi:hypothetical protein
MKTRLKEMSQASVPVSEIQRIIKTYADTHGMSGSELFNMLKDLLSKYKNTMNEKLKGGQKKIDVAPPKGKITGADFKKLRSMKESDHEVSMAQSSLQAIIEAAQELMAKLGSEERNIPGWIQDHITNAENYIEQAAQGFHELEYEKEPEEDTSFVSMMNSMNR